MAERVWAALRIEAAGLEPADLGDHLAAALVDHDPAAIEDLAELPLPPGGLWDPTYPPPPDPPAQPLRWRVYFRTAAARDAAAAALRSAWPGMAIAPLDVPDEDWAARSQRALTAVRAGRFLVAPPWDVPADVAPDVTVIVIEPSMGFGTGHHASTRLCLQLLSALDLRGRDVLDVGTGSGVLALAAARSGARAVTAVDVDADAIAAAEASAALNPAGAPVRFEVADIRIRLDLSGDVVLANLTGGMLTSAADRVRALVRPGGTLVVSGFDLAEAPGVADALALPVRDRRDEDGWVGLALTA